MVKFKMFLQTFIYELVLFYYVRKIVLETQFNYNLGSYCFCVYRVPTGENNYLVILDNNCVLYYYRK